MPDSWIYFKAFNFGFPILLELDRDTMEQRAMREKITALITFLIEEYAEHFNVPFATIAFVVPDERRQAALCEWIVEECRPFDIPGDDDEAPGEPIESLFRVAAIDPLSLSPTDFFLSPYWRVPGSDELVPLLEP